MILFSILFFLIISLSVVKKKVQIKHALVWYLTSLVLIFIALCPSVLDTISDWFGIIERTNSVFLIIIAFLLLIVFLNNMMLSKTQEEITLLIQEISILKAELKQRDEEKLPSATAENGEHETHETK